MIAKLVVGAGTRDEAVALARSELARLVVAGPRTNVCFLANLLEDADVRAGRMDTGLIDRKLDDLAEDAISHDALLAGAGALLARRMSASGPERPRDPWGVSDAFQLGPMRSVAYTFNVDGRPTPVVARWTGGALRLSAGGTPEEPTLQAAPARDDEGPGALVVPDGSAVVVVERGAQARVSWPSDDVEVLHPGEADDAVRAPITGRLAAVLVESGASVDKGDRIAVVEAMKMEHVLHAPRAGIVARLAVKAGDQIAEGALVAEIADNSSAE